MNRWLIVIALVTAACGGAAPENRVKNVGSGAPAGSARVLPTATAPGGPAPPLDEGICAAEKPACDEGGRQKDVALGGGSVTGKLPPEVIERGVRSSIEKIRLCYRSALARDPGLRGTVKIKFVIGLDGLVHSARDEGSQLPNTDVIECVRREILQLKFPGPEGGAVTVVRPFVFEPSP